MKLKQVKGKDNYTPAHTCNEYCIKYRITVVLKHLT
jgi:hypothetical protein